MTNQTKAIERERGRSSTGANVGLPTLQIVDLLATKVQSVRFELIGPQSGNVMRLGTALVYGPMLVLGYLLLLVAVMKTVAVLLGWGITCTLFGAAHVAVGVWGIRWGRGIGFAARYDVVDPTVGAPNAMPRETKTAAAAATSDTLPNVPRLPMPLTAPGGVGSRPGRPLPSATTRAPLP